MKLTVNDRPVTPNGLVIIDKPAGWTSHDVVGRMRRLASTRRVGHAGTLDPMATGVLVIGVNKATKLLTFLVGCDKDYDATIRLGMATVTDDAEGDITQSRGAAGISDDAIHASVKKLQGDIMQVPSSVSAIKINGERSYARVRGGEEVALAPRPVTVSRFDISDIHRNVVDGVAVIDVFARVTVSSGTYVRALARDLGALLETGGHLTSLRRTRVGGFDLSQARTLDEIAAEVEQNSTPTVVPMAQAARDSFPVHNLDEQQVRALIYGQRIDSAPPHAEVTAAIAPDGTLAAILDESGKKAASKVTFAAM